MKNYLISEYRNLLNLITILLVVIVNIVFFNDILSIFVQDGVSYLGLIIIVCLARFFLDSKFLQINSFLNYLADFQRFLEIYRDLLQEQCVENNLKSRALFLPVDDYFKPKNFLDGFKALDFEIKVLSKNSRIKAFFIKFWKTFTFSRSL